MTSTNSKVKNASAAKNFTNVATKTHDGASKPAAKIPRAREPVRKHEDPFLYYSHQETRINALLLRNDEDDEQVCRDRETVVRKTRISFELHPYLLLEDILPVDDVPEAEVRGIDTSGDGLIDAFRRLLFPFPVDGSDTEM
jgi:hypothetical protein